MQCINPKYIPNPKYNPNMIGYTDKFLKVPCGNCPNCLCNKRKELGAKLIFNYKHKFEHSGIFITLTYSNEYLPLLTEEEDFYSDWIKGEPNDFYTEDGKKLKLDSFGNPIPILDYEEIHKYIDRLNHQIKRNKAYKELLKNKVIYPEWKFVYCGEYGTEGNRPHWHIGILGINNNPIIQEIIKKEWRRGHIDIQNLGIKGIMYITKYITKSWISTPTDPRPKPKVITSKGLDKAIIEFYGWEELRKNNYNFRYGTAETDTAGLGRYYITKYGGRRKREWAKIAEQMEIAGIEKHPDRFTENYGYTFKEMEQYQKEEAILFYRKKILQMRNAGEKHHKIQKDEMQINLDFDKLNI